MPSPRPPLALALALALGGGLAGCGEPGKSDLARGNVLAARRQPAEAAEAYRAAARAAPDRARPRELLGHLLYDQGQRADARSAWEDALRVEPRAALEAEIGLARLDADEGRLDDALARLGKVLDRQPDNLFALVSRANAALQRGQPLDAERALADATRALALDGRGEAALYAKARALAAAHRPADAAAALEALRARAPRSPLPAYGEARLAAERGDRAAALERLAQARKLATNPDAWRPAQIREDPSFRALAQDPAFLAAIGP